jgi:hypothetical protein
MSLRALSIQGMPFGFGLLAVFFVLLAMFFHEPWVMGPSTVGRETVCWIEHYKSPDNGPLSIARAVQLHLDGLRA